MVFKEYWLQSSSLLMLYLLPWLSLINGASITLVSQAINMGVMLDSCLCHPSHPIRYSCWCLSPNTSRNHPLLSNAVTIVFALISCLDYGSSILALLQSLFTFSISSTWPLGSFWKISLIISQHYFIGLLLLIVPGT